jgi:hypothetical protein
MFGVLTVVEHDLDRNPLHYLDVIARRILGWQQAVEGPARAGNIKNVTVVGSAVGVYGYSGGLTRAHVPQLRFFEIRCHPDVLTVQGDDSHQLLPYRDVLANLY